MDISATNVVVVDAVVESPRGSRNTYALDARSGRIRLVHTLFTATSYPVDHGCLLGTSSANGAPLGALVLLKQSTFPGCHIRVRPIGVLWVGDERGREAKVLAVPATDVRFTHVQDLGDVDAFLLEEIKHFFGIYMQLDPQGGGTTIEWGQRDDAVEAIVAGQRHHRSGLACAVPL